MKIIDEYGKEREADIIKVITHEYPDVINEGEKILEDFLHVKIKGKNLEWESWIPLEKFKELNPEVIL